MVGIQLVNSGNKNKKVARLQKVKIQIQLKKVAFVAFKKLKFKFKQRCKRKIKIYIAYTKIICYALSVNISLI